MAFHNVPNNNVFEHRLALLLQFCLRRGSLMVSPAAWHAGGRPFDSRTRRMALWSFEVLIFVFSFVAWGSSCGLLFGWFLIPMHPVRLADRGGTHTCQPSVIRTESPSFCHGLKPPSRRRKSPSFDDHFEIKKKLRTYLVIKSENSWYFLRHFDILFLSCAERSIRLWLARYLVSV